MFLLSCAQNVARLQLLTIKRAAQLLVHFLALLLQGFVDLDWLAVSVLLKTRSLRNLLHGARRLVLLP